MRIRILLACLCTAILSACLSPDNTAGQNLVDAGIKRPVDTTTIKPPIKNGGWDDFPNKAMPDLQEMASKIKKLPVPMGIRYDQITATPPSAFTKSSAAPDTTCPDGPKEVFGYTVKDHNMYMVDTIRYYDTTGTVSCHWKAGSTQRVTHDRHIIDLASGQSWEHIEDSVTEQDVLPGHHIGGTGLIKLNSGIDLAIDSYWLNMVTPYGESEAVILGGSLRMTWKNGYTLDLSIIKTMPYKALDFFPPQGAASLGERIMSGPIKHDTTLVGYFDIYADHSVFIRDWLGQPVTSP